MDGLAEHKTGNSKQNRKTKILCVTVTKELREEIDRAVASGIAVTSSELIRNAVMYYLLHIRQYSSTYMNTRQDMKGKDADVEARRGYEDEIEKMVLPGRQ